MTGERFDKIVTARAAERVEKSIATFKEACARAVAELLGYSHPWDVPITQRAALFAVLASNDSTKGWPSVLWKDEEAAVKKELLATMDEFQKALIAADKPQEYENSPGT